MIGVLLTFATDTVRVMGSLLEIDEGEDPATTLVV